MYVKHNVIIQQISCETAAYVQSLTGPVHNFEVAVLKLELDILDLEIGIKSWI